MRAPCPSRVSTDDCIRRARSVLLAFAGCMVFCPLHAQPRQEPAFRINVDMVMLTFNVLDARGRPVHGLKPEDVRIFEDGQLQKIATFAEGNETPMKIIGDKQGTPGTSVFILLDTSNRMYATLVHACDAIADFVRRLDPTDAMAVYTFSRNMWRNFPLTKEHLQARIALANVIAGDDTAVYNALLLTLRDAAKIDGRKAVILFSNGPDSASIISPYDVGAVAVNEGIPLYIISTEDAMRDRETAKIFDFLTTKTGGKLYCVRTWQDQAKAFTAIQNDIGSSYTVGYYPVFNPNSGFRHLRIGLTTRANTHYHVRVRSGYDAERPLAAR